METHLKKKYKILLIEPNDTIANSIIHWLKDKADIVHIINESNAQELADKHDWDLMITDINSPDINELDITRLVKESNPKTSILIIAENIKVDFILTAMRHHADGLMFKPLDQVSFVSRALQLAEESVVTKEKEKKIILAIGAHPDDVEIGCGGTLAKLHAEGCSINILTLSLGSGGGDPTIRKKEARNAAKILDAKLFLGNLTDTRISQAYDTITAIEKVVKQVNPTHIYTHSFYDTHQDHRNIYHATITACRQTSNLFCYLSPSCSVDFKPNIFININHFIDEKLKIISVYKSQMTIRPYLHPDMIMATARYWGRFSNYHLVEPMEMIKVHS